MGLKDWFSENIIDIGAGKPPAAPGPAAKPASPPVPEEVPVRSTGKTVAQVAREVPRPQIDPKLVEANDRPTISFDQVYKAAAVPTPLNGFDVFRVEGLLSNERLKALTPESKSAAVLVALDAQGVKIEDVIKDAVQRDKALDAFEQFQLKKLVDLQTKVEEENKRVQQEIEAFIKTRHLAMDANAKKLKSFSRELEDWRRQKQLEERRLYNIVAHFTSSNPITLSRTVSSMPPPDPGPDELGNVPDLEKIGKTEEEGLPPTTDLGAMLGKAPPKP